jgi:hypothetical protein
MARYYTATPQTATSPAALLDLIVDILTTQVFVVAPGSEWQADASYLPGTLAGEGYIRSFNSVTYANSYTADTMCYIYIKVDGTKIRFYWTSGVGWGGGPGMPVDAVAGPVIPALDLATLPNLTPTYVWVVGDEDHFTIMARSMMPESAFSSMVYGGFYSPHSASDAFPLGLFGNMVDDFSTSDPYVPEHLNFPTTWTSLNTKGMAIQRQMFQAFVNSGSSNVSNVEYPQVMSIGPIPAHRQMIPLDNFVSPAELFAYEQWVVDASVGVSKSMGLTEVYRVSNTLQPEEFYSIGVNSYFCWYGSILPLITNGTMFFMQATPGTAIP